jgi:hypothetical protein
MGKTEVGVRDGLAYNSLFEISLSLARLREGALKPVGINVNRQLARRFGGALVFRRFLLALPSYLRGERNNRRGNARASDDEERRLAILSLIAGLLDFRDRGREIDFARGAAPFGGRGSAGL